MTPLTRLIMCVAVDVRVNSKTFGKHEVFIIDNRSRGSSSKSLFLSSGIGNSFCVLGDEEIIYHYMLGKVYEGHPRRAVIYNDPDLGIKSPFSADALIISELDKNNLSMRQLFPKMFK